MHGLSKEMEYKIEQLLWKSIQQYQEKLKMSVYSLSIYSL